MSIKFILFICVTIIIPTVSKNILLLSHLFGVSHVKLYYKLAQSLIDKGYNVTEFNFPLLPMLDTLPYPKGLHRILLPEYRNLPRVDELLESLDTIQWDERTDDPMFMLRLWFGWTQIMDSVCRALTEDTAALHLLRSTNYSMIVMDTTSTVCNFAIPNYLGVRTAVYSPIISSYYLDEATGTPCPLSYVPPFTSDHRVSASFWSRLDYLQGHLFVTGMMKYTTFSNKMRIFGVPLNLILKSDLSMINSNFVLDNPRPLTHNYKLVGFGIGHRKMPSSMPRDIKEFIEDKSSIGTILLTTSSVGRTLESSAFMPYKIVKVFNDGFARFPNYRFIWRYFGPWNLTKHKNIMRMPWLPQEALLKHNKTVLHITHGGLNSVLEAITAGVPILGMPLFGDQKPNIQRVAAIGAGIILEKSQLSPQLIFESITNIINEPIYKSNALKYGSMLMDWLTLETSNPASEHVDTVMKNENISRWTKPKGADMCLFVYYSFDSILGIVIIITLLIFLIKTMISSC